MFSDPPASAQMCPSSGCPHKSAPSPGRPKGLSSPEVSQRFVGFLCCPPALPVHLLPTPEPCGRSEYLLMLISFGDERVSSHSRGGTTEHKGLRVRVFRSNPGSAHSPVCSAGKPLTLRASVSPSVKWGSITPIQLPLFQMWLNGPTGSL